MSRVPKGLENLTLYKKGFLVGTDLDGGDLSSVLPIDHVLKVANYLRGLPPSQRVMLVKASTGTGKTSVIPPEMYLAQSVRRLGMPKIGVVIPKVITTRGTFARILDTFPSIKTPRDMTFNTGNIKLGTSPLTMMTTGIFIKTIQNIANKTSVDDIKRFNIIIIDEAHKQSMEMDMILSNIKQIINAPEILDMHKPLFIFMSATLDVPSLIDYYNLERISGKENAYKHVVTVTGQTFNRIDQYIDMPYIDIIEGMLAEIVKIVTSPKFNFGDILIFLPTTKDINSLKMKLTKWIIDNKMPILPIQLTGSDVSNFSDNIFYKELPVDRIERFGKRISKVYIGTNVVEDGVTLTNLRYVIDSGYSKTVEFDPHYMATCTIIKPISKSAAQQRRGRTGRDNEGIAYSLFTERMFNDFPDQDLPEIMTTDFSITYLVAKSVGVDIMGLMHKPPLEMLHAIEDKLYFYGCLDGDNNLTEVGKLISLIDSMSLESAKMVLSGYAYGVCVADLITVAAAIESINVKTNTYMADQLLSAVCRVELYMFGNNPKSDKYVENVSYITMVNNGKVEIVITESMLSSMLDFRYRAIKNFATIGLNIYNVESEIADMRDLELGNITLDNNSKLFATLSNYKKCIYEGYKNNLIIKRACGTNNTPSFTDIRGHPVVVGDLYNSITTITNNASGITNCEYPTYFIAAKLEIKKSSAGSYELVASKLSVMDGFVGVDLDFMATYTYSIPTSVIIPENRIAMYEASLPKGVAVHNLSLVSANDASVSAAVARELEKQDKIKPQKKVLATSDDNDIVILSK